MKKLLIALVVVGLVASPVFAGLDDGVQSALHGDYENAFKEWKPLAEKGNASAQYFLGVLYALGRGEGKRNYEEAVKEAVKWYRLAAEQGHVNAQFALGSVYSSGDNGVPRDYKEMVKWFRPAANQGYPLGQLGLGGAYANGLGVKKTPTVAYALLNLSEFSFSKSNAPPKHRNSIQEEISDVAKEMSASEIKAAEALMQEMSKPGNLLKALDAYLKKHQ